MSRLIPISIAFCLLFLLTGFWDSQDIEKLNIHIGTALDLVPSSKKNQKQKKIKLTTQNISLRQNSPYSDSGFHQQKYENISGTGKTIIGILNQFPLENEQESMGAHLKVIVIGEELAKQMNLNLLLNQHSRHYQLRDSCVLLIAKGLAADTLKTKDEIPAFKLIGITNNKYKTTRILPDITLGKAQNLMALKSNYIIQSVGTRNKEITYSGGAIMEGGTNKLVGFLTKEEVEGLNWITGNAKGGITKGRDPKTNGLVLYEISSTKSKITPHIIGNHISFDINIKSVGRLSEDWVLAGNAFSNKFIKRAETATKKEVERLIKQTLYQLQKKYHIDVAGFGEQLRIHYPEIWNKYKKDWNKHFSDVPIQYQVNISIGDYMIKAKKK